MLKGSTISGTDKEKASMDKFHKSCVSKMRTIMIGAISDLEKIYQDQDQDQDLPEEFDIIRKNILDRGNNLIRAFEDELKHYTIIYNSNFIIFKSEG